MKNKKRNKILKCIIKAKIAAWKAISARKTIQTVDLKNIHNPKVESYISDFKSLETESQVTPRELLWGGKGTSQVI